MSDVVDHTQFVDRKDAYEKGYEAGRSYERSLDDGDDKKDKTEDASGGDGELYTKAELDALSQDEVNENWPKVSKSMEALRGS